MPEQKMTRVGIYARVSTSDQNSKMQISELRRYAEQREWKVVGVYVDNGVSGGKASRPELNRLMQDAHRRKFDAVLVWRFDRFARSTSHLLTSLETFRQLKINFISKHEAVDTSTPLGQMVFTIVAAVAEMERNIIRQRVIAGVNAARAKGVCLGRPRGSKIDAGEVRRLLQAGNSFRQVAEKMNIGIASVSRAARRSPMNCKASP